MITGLKTLSSRWPLAPAMATVTSLPITCAAHHRERLGLRGVDLARHDRAARLVGRQGELPDPAARPAREQTDVVGDLQARDGQHPRSAPLAATRASWAASAANLLGAVKGQPVSAASCARRLGGVVGVGVEAGAHGAAAERELEQRLSARATADSAEAELRGVARELLAEGERRGVHQVGAADLHHVAERRGALLEGARAGPPARAAGAAAPLGRGDVHHRGEHVVGGLRAVHVVVGVHRGASRRAAAPASSLARLAITSLAFMFVWVPLPVCQTTRGKWSSRSPAMTSSAARTMSAAPSSRSPRAVGAARRPSSPPRRRAAPRREALTADAEVFQRALRLRAPVAVRGTSIAHAVALAPGA
jgi:hypothetical protein